MKTRVYGNEKTHLVLTAKAQQIYSECDPLVIREYETDSGLSYSISGIIEAYCLTAEEVSEQIEALE